MNWIVYRVRSPRDYDRLGVVRAPHQPAALRRAWAKYRCRTNGAQRQIAVRLVKDALK